jgi:ATP-dependent HslUV protease ATP-binding subunit HslU
MSLPIEELTPRQIVAELDAYIIGQNAAKKAVAVALRNRYRRQRLNPEQRDDVMPKNILMIGPTGVGKTEIARRMAKIARAPFIKVEATKFTEVGYVGRDVESMVRDLAAASVRMVEAERMAEVRETAYQYAQERLIDHLETAVPGGPEGVPYSAYWPNAPLAEPVEFDHEKYEKEREAWRESLKERYAKGEFAELMLEIDTEEASSPFFQVFSAQGMEEMGVDMANPGGPFGPKRVTRRVSVAEALEVLLEEESRKLIDMAGVRREALHRAEQTGIIFIDEIDKVAGKEGGSGPDVSREGVQRDLLPVIEGSTVQTKFGPLKTDHILFIAAGAFHMSKPSDLIPELQGRLPIRVELEPLGQGDFARILTEPKNALVRQYQLLLGTEGVQVEFTNDAIQEIAAFATMVNEKTENIGARRLHTMMEKLLEDILFDAPECGPQRLVFDGQKVKEILEPIVYNYEKSRNVL